MRSNEIQALINEESAQKQANQPSNADAIARTYYEYHGWHDDGINIADNSLPYGFSEVSVA